MHERKDRQTYSREGDYLYRLLDDLDDLKTSGAEIVDYDGDEEIVKIPDKLGKYPVIRIGMNAFAGNQKIRRVFVPDEVTVIGKGAFAGCLSLGNVSLPMSLKVIRAQAFAHCSALRLVLIPAWTRVSDSAFSGCEQLRMMRHITYGQRRTGTSSDMAGHFSRMLRERKETE